MRWLVSFFLVVFLPVVVSSQNFEEYKQQNQNQYKQYQKEVDEGMNKLQEEFDAFVTQRNAEFATFLENPWKPFDVNEGELVPVDPKPTEKPFFTGDEKEPVKITNEDTISNQVPEVRETPPQKIIAKNSPKLPENSNPLVNINPRITLSPKPIINARKIAFLFYGQEVNFEADPKLFVQDIAEVNEETTSTFWTRFTEANYDPLIDQLLHYRLSFNLNDWGYYRLIRESANHLAQGNVNASRLLSWALLNQSGFKTRVGYHAGEGFLLVPFKQKVYDHYYVDLEGIRYYVMENKGTQLFTYPKDFEGTYKQVDLNVYHPLNFKGKLTYKTYRSPSLEHEISIPVNPNAVTFFNDFPPSELKVYFDAGLTPETKDALISSLQPFLDGKTEQEQVQILLSFVQHAFEYMVDQKQFDREKAFFPDEIFFYPYSDCEDRSILFTYLVHNLLGLDIVGLDYPGHIATAVAFSGDVHGDYYEFKDKKYTVCDPTYIGAPIGATMPQFKEVKAEIIFTENIWNTKKLEDKIWSQLTAAGCFPGGTQRIINAIGTYYTCGWFDGTITVNGKNYTSKGGKDVFIARFDASGEFLWFLSGGGTGADIASTLFPGKNGSVYLSGTFSGDFSLADKSVSTEEKDVFIAGVNRNGQVNWLNSLQLKSAGDGKNLAFVGKFNQQGNRISADYYPEGNALFETGITEVNNDIYLAGAFNTSPGLSIADQAVTHSNEKFDYVAVLKEENDALIAQKCEKNMAALFAVLNVLNSNGTLIPGESAQEALDTYNPAFKKQCSDIYESLGLVDFMKNSDGLVVIKTNATKGVSFDMMKVSNNATLKISDLPNGNAKIDFISGVKVGKSFIWFPLNYVLLEHNTGDMIFDYDKDHTKKKSNLKNDILGL